MDEIVIRGMLKWPDVPAVYGWLSLDRRGSWMIKNLSGRFERIANAAVNEFIGRNYAADEQGRWYFQNGPQRVFVALDYTPWVYRLDDSGEGLLAHTGVAARSVDALYLDEAGALLVRAELGIGVLLDRDGAGRERTRDDSDVAGRQRPGRAHPRRRPAGDFRLRATAFAPQRCAGLPITARV